MYIFNCGCVQAQSTIQELFGRIRNIKEKAEHSEHMVWINVPPYTTFTCCVVYFRMECYIPIFCESSSFVDIVPKILIRLRRQKTLATGTLTYAHGMPWICVQYHDRTFSRRRVSTRLNISVYCKNEQWQYVTVLTILCDLPGKEDYQ